MRSRAEFQWALFDRRKKFTGNSVQSQLLKERRNIRVILDAGGVRLMLAVAEDPKFDHPGSILYYRVDDINAVAAALSGRGAHFTSEPHLIAKMPDHELWMAFLEDSEGNTLGLMSEVR